MKIIVGIFMLTAFAIAALAQQDAKAVTPAVPAAPMPSISAEKIVKNSPFSADAVSESVQTLADGNRIVRSSTSKLYRNSEGRFRREIANGSGGVAGTIYTYGSGITILDPVVGYRYQLDTHLMTAQQSILRAVAAPDVKMLTESRLNEVVRARAAAGEGRDAGAEKNRVAERLVTQVRAAAPVAVISGTAQGGAAAYPSYATGTISATGGSGTWFPAVTHTKYETRTEKLGTQNIEGVEAEGTRRTTTIPAGAIGNERPIDIVYESWYSNDLQLVVLSKTSDPRIGDQTYRLTNITRSEPDPSLFSLPAGYRLVGHPSSVYKVSTARTVAEKPVVVKSASGPTAVANKP